MKAPAFFLHCALAVSIPLGTNDPRQDDTSPLRLVQARFESRPKTAPLSEQTGDDYKLELFHLRQGRQIIITGATGAEVVGQAGRAGFYSSTLPETVPEYQVRNRRDDQRFMYSTIGSLDQDEPGPYRVGVRVVIERENLLELELILPVFDRNAKGQLIYTGQNETLCLKEAKAIPPNPR